MRNTILAIAMALSIAPTTTRAELRPCGDVTDPVGVSASDALAVLRKAVKLDVALTCGPASPTVDLSGVQFFKFLDEDRSDNLDLSFADLSGADFHGLDMHHVNFNGAILRDADLSGIYWGAANFNGADLRGANLRGATFDIRTFLMGADLRGADLREAKMIDPILLGARLDGALLEGVVWGPDVICPDGSSGGPCQP